MKCIIEYEHSIFYKFFNNIIIRIPPFPVFISYIFLINQQI